MIFFFFNYGSLSEKDQQTKQSNAVFKCPGLGFGLVTTASTWTTAYQDGDSSDAGTNPSSPFTPRAEAAREPQRREGAWAGGARVGREAGSCMFSPEAAVAFVGVEAAAWFRAWAGMRIEARDGLLDSSGGEVEQTELAHCPRRAPRAGSAPWVSPRNGNLGWNACPYSQRSRYVFFFADQREETTVIFGKAVSRARLSKLHVVVHYFPEKDSILGVSKEPAKPVAYQRPENAVTFRALEGFPSQTHWRSVSRRSLITVVLLWALVQQASSCNSCSKSFRDLVLWLTQASLSQGPRNPRPSSHSSLLGRCQEGLTSPLKARGKARGIGLLGNLNGQQNAATTLSEDINQGKNSHVF